MKKLKLIFIYALCCLSVQAQSPQSGTKHFAKDGLSFDYPASWALADRSTSAAQHLVITLPAISTLIMVIAHRDAVTTFDQSLAVRSAITEPFIENMAEKFRSGKKMERESLCTEVGDFKAVGGVRLRGLFNNLPTTGEVYTFLLGRRFVNLVYIRADKDDAQGSPAWGMIRSTLKIETLPMPPGQAEDAAELLNPSVVSGGVLNGKALSLPKPEYPRFAIDARASGIVKVQVTIDEKGSVISARAISGHHLLHPSSVEAARGARFTPTLLCGQPVKVTGVITYNYVYG